MPEKYQLQFPEAKVEMFVLFVSSEQQPKSQIYSV